MTEQTASRNVARSAAGMGAVAAVSRLFGAARVVTIAVVLGTTSLGDAFNGANSFSNVLFELLAAGALSAVLVPSFLRHFDTEGDRGLESLARDVLGAATLALGAVAVAGCVASGVIANLYTLTVRDSQTAAQQRHVVMILLLFFIPQVVLYGLGAVATAVLQAQRKFLVPAMAPIGNTVVMVGFLVAFRFVEGADPGLSVSTTGLLLLGGAGTLGVAAFVAAPTIAAWRTGVRLVPSFRMTHPELRPLLKQSGWASVQHGCAALLLGTASVMGASVAGGVVAYTTGWFFFQAPSGVVSEPVYTTVLPELVEEHAAGDTAAMLASLRWGLDSIAMLLVPLTGLAVVLAGPALAAVSVGAISLNAGPELIAAALAALALGLVPYGSFFLLARAWFVLGESQAGAAASAVGSLIGVVLMVAGGQLARGSGVVWALGVGHTATYVVGCVVLAVRLRRRLGGWPVPPVLPAITAVTVIGAALAWAVIHWWNPSGHWELLVATAVAAGSGIAVMLAGVRLLRIRVTARQTGSSNVERSQGATQ